MVKELSAGAVIFRNDSDSRKYLVLHYPEQHWDFAKGHIEGKESEKETAIREVREETGITSIVFVDGFCEKISYYFTVNKKTIFKEVFFFLAQTNEDKVKLSHEHIDFKWLSYDEAITQLTYKNARTVLERAHNYLNGIGNEVIK